MHTEHDPLDEQRLDLEPSGKPTGYYSDKIISKNACYIKISLEMLKRFDNEEEIQKALEAYLEKKSA